MALLNEAIQRQIRQIFEGMESAVKLVLFTQTGEGTTPEECQMCEDTRNLIEEVAALSEKISVEIYDFAKDTEAVERYKVDKVPALAILGGKDTRDFGIRFYGIPSGYEFSSLIEDITLASKGEAELSPRTMQEIARLNLPVHIQVYVTPT